MFDWVRNTPLKHSFNQPFFGQSVISLIICRAYIIRNRLFFCKKPVLKTVEGYFSTKIEALHRACQSSSFFRADAFFEKLLFQNSQFFPAFFSQNIYLFRAKLLPRNQTLRTGNFLVQLPFRTAIHRRHLQRSYFFEVDSSAQHQLFQKKQDSEKAYFFRKAKFRITYFFWAATF